MSRPLQPETGSFFDLSTRAKFVIRGPDARRFLNGQVTNDLQKASETEAIEACILNQKGKINAHLFISATAETYILDADTNLREALPARLDRYIIADDVQVDDVTDQFGIFHVLSAAAPSVPNEWKLVRARRFTREGWDVWLKQSEAENARRFFSTQVPMCDEECAERLRIESGIPRWGRELTEQIIPVEANLEERCIDYSKGCYIGQEVISRIKMSGQTNKKLCGLLTHGETPLLTGMHLALCLGNSPDVGWITSADRSRRLEKFVGLGFVKRGFNAPGTSLRASYPGPTLESASIQVEVSALPFSGTE